MRHVDTSLLIDALTGARRSGPALQRWLADGNRLEISTLVVYEYLRGPRTTEQREFFEHMLSAAPMIPFGIEEAGIAAHIYRGVNRARGREIDLGIAACALMRGATLWTLNPRDFSDIPGLNVV